MQKIGQENLTGQMLTELRTFSSSGILLETNIGGSLIITTKKIMLKMLSHTMQEVISTLMMATLMAFLEEVKWPILKWHTSQYALTRISLA